MKLWGRINHWAKKTPDNLALNGFSYGELARYVQGCARTLPDVQEKRVGLFMANRPLWAIYDIALTLRGAVVVPLPIFFSAGQFRHIASDANLDYVVVDRDIEVRGRELLLGAISGVRAIDSEEALMAFSDLEDAPVRAIQPLASPSKIARIIYTSGTTGTPKGVMVTLKAIEEVTEALIERTGASSTDRHLSLLPLSTLIETIAGLYVPLSAGASVFYAPMDRKSGVSADAAKAALFFDKISPTTLNLVPALLDGFMDFLEKAGEDAGDGRAHSPLRFVACGGAAPGRGRIKRAQALGLPLYEGYGLSECSTVVSLNGTGGNRPGSAGRPLGAKKVSIAPDGEIIVSGSSLMHGYVGQERLEKGPDGISTWATGDVGRLDEDGYLYVDGRKDSVITTSYGRNVSPEWVEGELGSAGAVAQSFVYGNSRPFVSALVVPGEAWLRDTSRRLSMDYLSRTALVEHPAVHMAMSKELAPAIKGLPQYAAVERFVLIDEPFTPNGGLTTPDGRLRREQILKRYKYKLDSLYAKNPGKGEEGHDIAKITAVV